MAECAEPHRFLFDVSHGTDPGKRISDEDPDLIAVGVLVTYGRHLDLRLFSVPFERERNRLSRTARKCRVEFFHTARVDPVDRHDDVARAHARFRCGAGRPAFRRHVFEPYDLDAARRERKTRRHAADIIKVGGGVGNVYVPSEEKATGCKSCRDKKFQPTHKTSVYRR